MLLKHVEFSYAIDVPVATMQLGAKMNPNDIEEGDDVYFGCEVDANPPAYKVVWEHNVSQHIECRFILVVLYCIM